MIFFYQENKVRTSAHNAINGPTDCRFFKLAEFCRFSVKINTAGYGRNIAQRGCVLRNAPALLKACGKQPNYFVLRHTERETCARRRTCAHLIVECSWHALI